MNRNHISAKGFQYVVVLIAVLGLSGCALHSGYMTNSAALGSNNFIYIKRDVQGTATATYFFGIGGLGKMALVNEAKKDLLNNYPLQPNQTLVDVTVNFRNTFILIYMQQRCTVTASIVEFR